MTSFFCSLKFLLFQLLGHTKKRLQKKYCKFSISQVFFFEWIENNPISILYQFQIDISSSSREIKYQNIGWTHRYTDTHTHIHTDTQTDRVKTIPRNPLRGRGNGRPIVTTFGTLIENMSRTGLYDCYIFSEFFWTILCMLNVKYWRIFLWRHFSGRSNFYCFIW